MRVIAGKYKSRLIKSPAGVPARPNGRSGGELRPTSDRVKESLFGILGNFVMDKDVLDLFSGTGNLGIEALSRGAKSCIFVDNNPRCITAINKNLESLGIKEDVEVILKDVFKYVKQAGANGLEFDLILLDPPYYKEMIKKSLRLLDNHIIIKPLGFIVTEHYKTDDLPAPGELRHLELCRQEKYGGTFLSFYRRASK